MVNISALNICVNTENYKVAWSTHQKLRKLKKKFLLTTLIIHNPKPKEQFF